MSRTRTHRQPASRVPRARTLMALAGALLAGCASSGSGTTNPGATPEDSEGASPDEASDVTTTPLPADLHVVVFFETERGHEHLDVRVISSDTSTYISGVRADESRALRVTQRIDLTGEQRQAYAARIAALGRMPRCEPLARFPNEPLFRIESPEFSDEGPSLWLRESGERMIASNDPCLGYAQLAHFVYTTWMSHRF